MTMEGHKRKYCIIANWKCNGSTDFVRDIVNNMINVFDYETDKLDFIVLPGMLHVNLAKARIKDHVMIGAQNCSAFPSEVDDHTGEVSAE
jgi:triosephosphate isomerase